MSSAKARERRREFVGAMGRAAGWARAQGTLEPFTAKLEAEGVLGLAVQELGVQALSSGPKSTRVLEEVPRTADSLRSLASRVARVLEQRDLPVIVMKTAKPYWFVDHDVDVVAIDAARVRKYRIALREAGFRRQWRPSQLKEPDKEFYVDSSSGSGIRIHLHRRFSWNGVTFLDSRRCWYGRSYARAGDRRIPVPGPLCQLLIVAAHAVYENGRVSLADYLDVCETLESGDCLLTTARHAALDFGWRLGLEAFVKVFRSLSREPWSELCKPIADSKRQKIGHYLPAMWLRKARHDFRHQYLCDAIMATRNCAAASVGLL